MEAEAEPRLESLLAERSSADLEQLVEGSDLEATLAAGRDGRGELPSSFFETYSAFANTDGGIVLLGVEELPDGKLVAKGMTEPAKVVRAFWDGLKNTQRVNANLLREQDIETLDVEGKTVIRAAVPLLDRREIERVDDLGHEPRQVSFRQPVLHTRRQTPFRGQARSYRERFAEPAPMAEESTAMGAARDRLKRREGTTLYALLAPSRGPDRVKSDRLLAEAQRGRLRPRCVCAGMRGMTPHAHSRPSLTCIR